MILAVLVLLVFIGLSYYSSVQRADLENQGSSSENQSSAALNLTNEDTDYQFLYPDYEIAYVYILNTFSKQLDKFEEDSSSEKELNQVIDDFDVLVSDFLAKVPESTEKFQKSRDFAVSSADKTKSALAGFKRLVESGESVHSEKEMDALSDAVADFKESQEAYKETMETIK